MSKLAESDEFHGKFAIDKEKNFYEGRDLEVLAGTPRYLNWIIEDLKPCPKGRRLGNWCGVGDRIREIGNPLVFTGPC